MLRFPVRNKPRKLPKSAPGGGLQARIDKMRKLVTALIRHERLEGKTAYMDETRGYAERLIQIAAKHGDSHEATMKLADYWLLEKDLIHKLFKVIVPRYEKLDTVTPITSYYRLPDTGGQIKMACIELKGNPWPPVVPKHRDISGSLVNILINEARKEYRVNKYKEMTADGSLSNKDTHVNCNQSQDDASSTITGATVVSAKITDSPGNEVHT